MYELHCIQLVRQDMHVNEHERISNSTLRHKLKLVIRKDMDVNEHERISNSTLRHTFKKRNSAHRRVYNNEHNSYPKISMKWLLFSFADKRWVCPFLVPA